jgi:hypothetical protein
MSKSIGQQVREKIKEASSKLEQGAGDAPAAEASETAAFIASATPAPDAPSVEADAPEVPDAPLDGAPSAEPKAEAASAPETPKPEPVAATDAPVTATATDEEWEDAEWDDDSVGSKLRIKAPKGMAEKIRSGWMAHADYSRKAARLAHFQSEFQPQIESGYMDRVLPLYRMLNQDEVLANAVAQLYTQRLSNQPLSYVQPGTEQPVRQQQQASVQEEQPYAEDPYLQSIMQPLRAEIGQVRSYLEEQSRTAEQQRTQAQQTAAQESAQRLEWSHIHQRLHQAYPGEFSGDAGDLPKLQQLKAYADRAGYSRESHGWFGRIVTAKQDIDRYAAPAPATVPSGTAATPSAGAAAVQARAEEIARKARVEVANGTVVSGSSQPSDPPPPKPPKTRDKNGAPLPVKQAMRNIIRSAKARAES